MLYGISRMAGIRYLINETFAMSSRYRAVLLAIEVPVSKKFPTGIKARFVMIDTAGGFPRLLVDNHEPFGFHMHTQLPEDSSVREQLSVSDHNEALAVFIKEAERIIADERD